MKIRFTFLLVATFFCLSTLIYGCGGKENTVAKQSGKKPAPPPKAATKKPKVEEEQEAKEATVHYDSTIKIDPFRPLIVEQEKGAAGGARRAGGLQPLQRYDLDQLKVVGIISNVKPPRALIEDADGDGFIVSSGSLVGRNDGVVVAIHEDEVIIEENELDTQARVVKKRTSMKLLQPEEAEEK